MLNTGKPKHDIVTAGDILTATRSAARAVTGSPTEIDPQVASLEKYLILADKGITMLSQIQGLMERYRAIVGSQEVSAQNPPIPVTRIPHNEVTDMPDHPHRSVTAIPEETPAAEEPETLEVTEVTTMKQIGAAQISQVLSMILSQQPDLTVAQLKQLIDGNPDMIDHLLHVYMTAGGDVGSVIPI